ncbi:hypothetical protein [Lactiplantibacillus plantarum]|uniref:hypothetical protein n=1 Tax=Lactiplantibacillus plantarum TaxID=1590 RepID=UPI003F535B74
MLGVIKMDEKKVLKTIDEMLADPWQVDIQELFEASFRSCLRSLLTSKQDPYKGHSNHDFTGI